MFLLEDFEIVGIVGEGELSFQEKSAAIVENGFSFFLVVLARAVPNGRPLF